MADTQVTVTSDYWDTEIGVTDSDGVKVSFTLGSGDQTDLVVAFVTAVIDAAQIESYEFSLVPTVRLTPHTVVVTEESYARTAHDNLGRRSDRHYAHEIIDSEFYANYGA